MDRQVSEAVRIARTGAEKILNCKGEYNRCQLPRMMMVDTRAIPTLGEMVPQTKQQARKGSDQGGEEEDQEETSDPEDSV